MSSDGPQWMADRTLGQSRPIPNAIVATTTRKCESGSRNASCSKYFPSPLGGCRRWTCLTSCIETCQAHLWGWSFLFQVCLSRTNKSWHKHHKYGRKRSSFLSFLFVAEAQQLVKQMSLQPLPSEVSLTTNLMYWLIWWWVWLGSYLNEKARDNYYVNF